MDFTRIRLAYMMINFHISHRFFRWMNVKSFSLTGVTESVAGDVLLMNKIDEQWKNPTDAIWR